MFGSDILEIIIGMVFIFLLLSLVCSAANEFVETLMKNRAKDLERGIAEMMGDPNDKTGIVAQIYNHGLVNSLYKGPYAADDKGALPSYIPSASFALAVMDFVQNPPPGVTVPQNLIDVVTAFKTKAPNDAHKLQANLEDWFNNSMDRVSGWYKRRTQWIILALGLIVAVTVNADAVRIAQSLSNDASLRKGLVASAQARANQPVADPNAAAVAQARIQQELQGLDSLGLPIGWRKADLPKVTAPPAVEGQGWWTTTFQSAEVLATIIVLTIMQHLVGWVLTAIACSMGAPFWFDLLGKVVAVRSSVKPGGDDSQATPRTGQETT